MMEQMRLTASACKGRVTMIPSKSVSHRALICAALAQGESDITNLALSQDIAATMDALVALGLCEARMQGDACNVRGGLKRNGTDRIDCAESGSTIRFLIPLALDGRRRVFTGRGRLLERPMRQYETLFGVHTSSEGIVVEHMLRAGEYAVEGNVSSQFITGLLFALPMLEQDSIIRITTPLESQPYIEITRQVQERFGVRSEWQGNHLWVPGNQHCQPRDLRVEGDYSHAAFFGVSAALAGSVTLCGLEENSAQGDKEILNILTAFGAEVSRDAEQVQVRKRACRPFCVDVSQIPDLVPALAVLACGAKGKSVIYGAARLRMKESDRLQAMTQELTALGASIEMSEEALTIYGNGTLRGGCVDSHNDHRIAMALSVAAFLCEEPVLLRGGASVAKSAPQFFEEFTAIGGNYERDIRTSL